jgi:hypothetical protein
MNDQLPDLTLRNGRVVTPSGVIGRRDGHGRRDYERG